MKNIKELISSYLIVYENKQIEPVKTFLDLWQCLIFISQINSNKHSSKNKTDKDKLNYLFKDYNQNILELFKNSDNISAIKNILLFTNSECPILITRFEDLKDQIDNIDELFNLQDELRKLRDTQHMNMQNMQGYGNININDKNDKINEKIKQIEKKSDYFIESLVSLLHLGKNKMFKSINLDSIVINEAKNINKNADHDYSKHRHDNMYSKNEASLFKFKGPERQIDNNFSDFDFEFSINASELIYNIINNI